MIWRKTKICATGACAVLRVELPWNQVTDLFGSRGHKYLKTSQYNILTTQCNVFQLNIIRIVCAFVNHITVAKQIRIKLVRGTE